MYFSITEILTPSWWVSLAGWCHGKDWYIQYPVWIRNSSLYQPARFDPYQITRCPRNWSSDLSLAQRDSLSLSCMSFDDGRVFNKVELSIDMQNPWNELVHRKMKFVVLEHNILYLNISIIQVEYSSWECLHYNPCMVSRGGAKLCLSIYNPSL